MFWSKFKDGFTIIKYSIKFAFQHPWTLFPFLLTLVIYGAGLLYLFSVINPDNMTTVEQLLLAYGIYVVYTTLLSISSLILLELLEQKEEVGQMNIFKAIKDAFVYDLYKTIPIILVWSVIKVGILLLNVLASSLKDKEGRSTFLSRVVSRWADRINKGVRMLIFLMLPGIALDDRSTRGAYREAKHLFSSYFATILSGYGLTSALNSLTFLPLILFMILANSLGFPEWSIYVMVAYLGISWSFGMLVEQLYCGELYIWYSYVNKEAIQAQQEGRSIQNDISYSSKPDYLKDVVSDDPFAKYDNLTFD